MKRAALIVVTVLSAMVALGPGPAGAVIGATVVTSRHHPGGGYVLRVTAASGGRNELLVSTDCPLAKKCLVVQDGAGIKDNSSKCGPGTSHFTTCKLKGLRRVYANVRDGADSAEVSSRATVRGGGGADTLTGEGGNQRFLGGVGQDKITGGRGKHDYCDGQAGNDRGGAGCETKISL
jgi:Ca2+-binding RTX toxin-like protein